MTYNLMFDQEFAIINELTLVQVSTLAAFMTLPLWSKTISIDGRVWYQYSEEKMAEDFPLLFGVPKRCYKNISELCKMGFVQLTKIGREKYVSFTDLCASWNREKVQNWVESPKTDYKKSENGLNNSPKTDFPNNNYDINITNNIKTQFADGDLFPAPEKQRKARKTSEPLCLFADSRFADIEIFQKEFEGPEFAGIDMAYYFHAVADWSAQRGIKRKDWIAQTRNFIRKDIEAHKLHRIGGVLSPDAVEYLKDMAEGL